MVKETTVAQPVLFVNDLVTAVRQLSAAMDELSYLVNRYNEDNTLVTGYFSQPGARTDIVAADLVNVLTVAYTQLQLVYSTGAPTQQSLFDKVL
jgi:hypothetical protein